MDTLSYRSVPRLIWACSLAMGLVAGSAGGQTVTHLSPVGFSLGSTTRVTLYGQGLAGVRGLWTSFPSTWTVVADGADDTQVSFDLTVTADVDVGTYGLRCTTDTSMSEAKIVVVDDLPVVVEGGSNAAFESAQPLTIPTAVNGFIPAEQSRFFSFEVVEGQTVSIEVVGHRFGTGFDPLVRILAADGKEIMFHDNDEGLGYDCRFEHSFAAAGKHVLELRDTRFQGGAWAYHLRIGDFPIARVGFPAGATRGRPTSIAFPGRTSTDVPPLTVTPAPNDAAPLAQMTVRGVDGSTWIPLALDDAECQIELEPNDSPAEANATELGRTLEGRLQSPRDVDAYRFLAKAGQAAYFRSETRRLSSPADLVLRLLNAQGQEVASNDDQGEGDAEFTFSIPADGGYVLVVEDLHRRGGPEFVYRVATSPGRRDFAIRPSVEQIVVGRGGLYPIPVAIERHGVSEPIQLRAELTSFPTPMGEQEAPAGAAADLFVVRAPANAPLGTASLRLRGRSAGPAPLERFAVLSSLLRPKLDEILLLPTSLETQIAVSIVDRPFFTLSARVDAPAAARYASTPIVVEASREKFFDEAIALTVENLPETFAVKPQPIEKGASSVRFDVVSTAKSPLGRFPAIVSGTASFGGRSARVFAAPLILDVRPAASLTIAPPETTIAPGGKATVVVQAARLPAYSGPIEVALQNLPGGVTAQPATIAENALEVAVELAAAPDAPAATIANLVARGVFTINNEKETVDSPAAKLIVGAP
jgi:hypothetical protein